METKEGKINTESKDDSITLTVKVSKHWMTGGDPEQVFTLEDIKS